MKATIEISGNDARIRVWGETHWERTLLDAFESTGRVQGVTIESTYDTDPPIMHIVLKSPDAAGRA